jgi:hypothetical protein
LFGDKHGIQTILFKKREKNSRGDSSCTRAPQSSLKTKRDGRSRPCVIKMSEELVSWSRSRSRSAAAATTTAATTATATASTALEQGLNDGELIWRDNGLYCVTGLGCDGRQLRGTVSRVNRGVGHQIGPLFDHGVEHSLDLGDYGIGQFVGIAEGCLETGNQCIGRHRAAATTATATGRSSSGRATRGATRLCKRSCAAHQQAADDKRGN